MAMILPALIGKENQYSSRRKITNKFAGTKHLFFGDGPAEKNDFRSERITSGK